MFDPPDQVRVPRFPEPIELETLPPHLRDNPIARLHTQLPAGVERELVALAAEEDSAIEGIAREIASSVR